MSLKKELTQHYLENEADFDPEETKNVLEVLNDYNEDLQNLNKTDKTLLLRLINDDDILYEKLNSIEIPETNEEDEFL